MAEGPYKRPVIVKESKEVCDYCEHCRASKEFGQNFVKILSAACAHPATAKRPLDHDGKEVTTPNWCPVKKAQKPKTNFD